MLALKRVEEIVEENHAYAYVLDTYGIYFYDCPGETLGEVCQKRSVDINHLMHNLKSLGKNQSVDLNALKTYPIDLVIEYLKHAHHIFVKKSLPYIGKLVRCMDEMKYVFPPLIRDLKFIMPLFIEEFIHHIYEEEDHLFHYVNSLYKVSTGEIPPSRVYHLMERSNLARLAAEHENTDDEMLGIRKLTRNYTYGSNSDLLLRTVYRELRHFEKELVLHADIENKVLFPKAIELESEVRRFVNQVIPSN